MSRLLPVFVSVFFVISCGNNGQVSVLPGFDALLFVKRSYQNPDGTHDVNGGSEQVIDYQRYVPGGGLFVLEPPTPSGKLRNLTAGFQEVDINGVDLSFDAKRAVFSMRRSGDDYYHLYVANLDGSGTVQQLTMGDYDDIKPLFVPGDRIVFVTNESYTEMGRRADEYNHSRAVTQVASVNSAGADRRLCAHNVSHSADPFLLSDGTVAYSRWEHLGPVNDVKLFRMKPDCSQMVALAGQHGKPSNSLVQATELDNGVLVGIGTSRKMTIQAGALIKMDARAAGGLGAIAYDEQNVAMTNLTPEVPTGEESPPSGVGRYRTPKKLPGFNDKLLVSWANGDVNTRNELAETAPNFGIYLFDPEGVSRTLVYDDPQMWDLYGIPVKARDIPPEQGSFTMDTNSTEPAVFGSIDVTQTSLDQNIQGAQFGNGLALSEALKQATHVRVIEGFSSEIGPVGQFGLTMHEGAAIMGEVKVESDGSWEAKLNSKLPYHMQPLDTFGLSIRNQLTWVQAMPGESRRCGGCHESRTQAVVPRMGTTTIAQQSPANLVKPIAERIELPWYGAADSSAVIENTTYKNVQDLFNAKCVQCHSGGGNDPFAGKTYMVTVTRQDGMMVPYQVPYLDLSDALIAVEYEREVVNYPKSYVSLLYPSAMMADSVATGDVPPLWVVPGAARESRLIQKINAPDRADTTVARKWAWDKQANAPHPEDKGVDLSDAERLLLIRAADLGGQYWSRRNVPGGFTPNPTNY